MILIFWSPPDVSFIIFTRARRGMAFAAVKEQTSFERAIHKKGKGEKVMQESPELVALYGIEESRSGPEISAVERLMNEFEAHEAKEEKTL
ncbi:MAG: hypothetical protein ACREQK_01195, partial [Candidatus Binatia bacterium]